jgi:acyl-CoA synthetase (AMP-forming)/AMP-acid ligase II
MMEWLLERFLSAAEKSAFVHNDRVVTYRDVVATVAKFRVELSSAGVLPGEKVMILGDYSPEVFCLMLALGLAGCIVIPLTRQSVIEQDFALAISGCDWIAKFDEAGVSFELSRHVIEVRADIFDELAARKHSGLVLLSSGSTGKPKAIVHDFEQVAEKFKKQRISVIGIPFLMIDHFGGINTILAITSSLGTVVTVADRSMAHVCQAIETYKVELLPVTPSFLNLLLVSRAHEDYDLSSLKRITYGTEVMPQTTLSRLADVFPGVQLQQTYGLSELGVLNSQSRPDGSLWMRVGGAGFETEVRDGILWIRSQFAMLGYLNAPTPFDAEGWFNTQDRVEVDGEYLRILGRETDIINVGGQKVYPVEVENVIIDLPNIHDVAVYGEPHNLLGQIVVAKVKLSEPEPLEEVKKRIRSACRELLTSYKVPAKVVISEDELYSSRQKKRRQA